MRKVEKKIFVSSRARKSYFVDDDVTEFYEPKCCKTQRDE